MSIVLFAFCSFLPGLSHDRLSNAGKIKIMTSIFPLQQFAAAVTGNRGEVSLLLPPGASVHTWQPRSGDLLKLRECDLFIYVGADLEPWLADIRKGLSGKKVESLEARQGLELAEVPARYKEKSHHVQTTFDPHIWLDFELAGRIVDAIRDKLSSIDPEGALDYQKNAEVYKNKLRLLDSKYRHQLKDCLPRTLIVAGHAAFGYLARRYGLEQIALYGLSPDSHPTPRDLIEVVGLARQKGVQAVFYETTTAPDLARTLARELRSKTLRLNAGHNLTREEIRKGLSFFDIMEENLRILKDGLGCR